MKTRYVALIIGIIYLLAGVAAFFSALSDDRMIPDLVVDLRLDRGRGR